VQKQIFVVKMNSIENFKIQPLTILNHKLTRLSTSFGIGVIELNIEDPHSTKILLPAKYRDMLDWETINKLTMNSDFKEFLSRVKIDISSKKIHKKEYDPILEIEELKRNNNC
jgi:uncharacterized protein